MRITNKMITGNYLSNLSSLSSNLNTLSTKVSTGRSFLKSSEDAASAIRGYNIRSQLAKNDTYQTNIEHAQSTLSESESALNSVNDIAQEATEKILTAINGTNSSTERNILAQELKNLQEEMLATLNSSSSNTFYFGGTNIDSEPFSLDSNGKLMYNGVLLSSITDSPTLPTDIDSETYLSDSRYTDIGLNLAFDGTTGEIDKSTVFSYSITGLSITGYGKTTLDDGTAVSNNLYDIMGLMIDELESNDVEFSSETLSDYYGVFSASSDNILNAMTVVGAKTSYLEFMTDRLETQALNLTELQTAVEGADPAETIVDYTAQQLAYQAALQMGTSLLQPSIFDYMS